MRKPLSYANVTATTALVLAAGTGGAWAVDQINGNRLVDRSVRGRKLADDTVRGRQVKEASLNGLVKGKGRVLTGHTTQGSSDPMVAARKIYTPVGRFSLGCGNANGDTRYTNTTPGAAEVYRTVGVVAGPDVGEEDNETDRDLVTRAQGQDIGYSVTNATGPRVVELLVGKGAHAATFTAAAKREGESCSWTWELVSSG
jgi:hypothetical protein